MGLGSAGLQGMALDQKQPVSRKYISFLSFYPTEALYTILETSDTGLEKIGNQILNFRVGPKIGGYLQKISFLEFCICM